MSRKKNRNRRWGVALLELREGANLTQARLAGMMGHPTGKGKLSEIESGKLPIREEDIRLWVLSCKRTMFDFYATAARHEPGVEHIQPFVFPDKSK